MPSRYDPKRPLRHLKKHWRLQRDAPLGAPWSRRLDMLRRGVSHHSYALYPQVGESPSDYLPDAARLETFFINGTFARNVLSDKLLFTEIVGEVLDVPTIVALIERGRVFAESRVTTLTELVAEHPDLVLKPSGGTRGQGVVRLSGHTPSLEELVRGLDDYLVTETVQQAPYAEAVFPDSTNSVRVMTFVDPDTGEPFVGRAVHRFGGADTVPTDNWSRGGLCANVELATGRLGLGVRHAKRTGGRLEWQTHHPDTGAVVEGLEIPRWREICQELTRAVKTLPFLTYVGWDVVVTEDGFYVLEGNANPDLDLLQVHGGLLKDERVKAFYKHYKII